ncbi:MAG TPA: nitrate- and nitrite sensing domain-containing protein, partial [Kineosporiaceae bacterium]
MPTLVLLAGGGVLAAQSVLDGLRIRAETDAFTKAVPPTSVFITQLLAERHQSVIYAADPAAKPSDLAAIRAAVDGSAGPIRAQFHRLADLRPVQYRLFADQLDAFFGRFPAERNRIATHQATPLEVSTYFSDMSSDITVSLYQDVLAQSVASAAVAQTTSVTMMRAIDDLSDADGLAAASFAGPGLDAQTYQRFTTRLGAARSRLSEVQSLLEPTTARQLAAFTAGPLWARLEQNYRQVLQAGPVGAVGAVRTPGGREGLGAGRAGAAGVGAAGVGAAGVGTAGVGTATSATTEPRPDQARWGQDLIAALNAIGNITVEHIQYAAERSGQEADAQVRRGLVAAGLLLLLGVLVLLLATLAAGRLVRRLRSLRQDTLTLSRERLPRIVERLRAGESVDVSAELPPLSYGSDEVGQVASAFQEAQRTAVAAAAREAETRAGLRTVFLDIAHRNQTIVHRQLNVLDQAEGGQEDPDQLALLFQLDHLATRSRRNAENLIILGGGQPGRQWRAPVPLLDIVRSAISEAEDYVRVSVGPVPAVEITGTVVGDLIHLLAELVDNATSFSPPMSRVEVRGNVVGRGLVLEVEDQGLGIEQEQLDQLNALLHEAPEFQVMALAEEPRLGLFVVAQLAARHDIRVTLTPSPAYGGTRVVVLLPTAVLASVDTSRALAAGRSPAPAPPGTAAPDGATSAPATGDLLPG